MAEFEFPGMTKLKAPTIQRLNTIVKQTMDTGENLAGDRSGSKQGAENRCSLVAKAVAPKGLVVDVRINAKKASSCLDTKPAPKRSGHQRYHVATRKKSSASAHNHPSIIGTVGLLMDDASIESIALDIMPPNTQMEVNVRIAALPQHRRSISGIEPCYTPRFPSVQQSSDEEDKRTVDQPSWTTNDEQGSENVDTNEEQLAPPTNQGCSSPREKVTHTLGKSPPRDGQISRGMPLICVQPQHSPTDEDFKEVMLPYGTHDQHLVSTSDGAEFESRPTQEDHQRAAARTPAPPSSYAPLSLSPRSDVAKHAISAEDLPNQDIDVAEEAHEQQHMESQAEEKSSPRICAMEQSQGAPDDQRTAFSEDDFDKLEIDRQCREVGHMNAEDQRSKALKAAEKESRMNSADLCELLGLGNVTLSLTRRLTPPSERWKHTTAARHVLLRGDTLDWSGDAQAYLASLFDIKLFDGDDDDDVDDDHDNDADADYDDFSYKVKPQKGTRTGKKLVDEAALCRLELAKSEMKTRCANRIQHPRVTQISKIRSHFAVVLEQRRVEKERSLTQNESRLLPAIKDGSSGGCLKPQPTNAKTSCGGLIILPAAVVPTQGDDPDSRELFVSLNSDASTTSEQGTTPAQDDDGVLEPMPSPHIAFFDLRREEELYTRYLLQKYSLPPTRIHERGQGPL